jgi:hypothetical protein
MERLWEHPSYPVVDPVIVHVSEICHVRCRVKVNVSSLVHCWEHGHVRWDGRCIICEGETSTHKQRKHKRKNANTLHLSNTTFSKREKRNTESGIFLKHFCQDVVIRHVRERA